jgi:uncharacterized metal-binding protein
LVAAGFLFGGLMFGPDLDIRSCQYRRWGWLRWIWLPYQQYFRHRSLLTHGPIIGTLLRLLYLSAWIGGLAFMGIVIWSMAQQVQGHVEQWQTIAPLYLGNVGILVWRSFQRYPVDWLALCIGLELGAMSHSLSDWTESARKRVQQYGWQTLLSTAKKRKQYKPFRKKSSSK